VTGIAKGEKHERQNHKKVTHTAGTEWSDPAIKMDAADGGKKAITAKNKQRGVMEKQYTQLGHYVEAASNDDPAIFATSGFVPAPPRVPPQPLPDAAIDWIDRGSVTGSVVVDRSDDVHLRLV
jgi:hypothetical protein